MITNKSTLLILLIIFFISSLGMTSPRVVSGLIPEVLHDFQMVDPNSGWLITGNQLLWTSDGGISWMNITPEPDQSLRSSFFLNSNIGFVVTSKLNSDNTISFDLYRTADNGASWFNQPIALFPLTDPDASVASVKITFSDPFNGWLYFKRMTSSNFNVGTLLNTKDSGNTWEPIVLPIAGETRFPNTFTGYVVGGIQDQQLYRTATAGSSWAAFDPSPETNSRIFGPYFISGSLGEIVVFEQVGQGTNLKVFHTQDSGVHWTEKTALPLSENEWVTTPVSAVTGEIKILTPTQVVTYWQTAEMFETKDRVGNENISDFQMVDTNHGWAISHEIQCQQPDEPATCTTLTHLLKTQNGGVSWSKVQSSSQAGTLVSQDSRTISPDGAAVSSRTSLHFGQGFDQCEISTLSNLQKWKTNSPYSVINLYIGGAARACDNLNLSPDFIKALSIQGWKFIPTWVGPQAECTNFSITMHPNPATAYQQGKDQATDAARVARKYGLSYSDTDESGTVIYYDLEAFNVNDATCLNAAKAFINGWVEELHSKGITAGVYGSVCSSGLKEFSTIANPPDVIWPALWIDDSFSSSVTADNLPCVTNSMWGNHQRIFQYTGAHLETWGNTAMYIDVDMIDGIVADISNAVGVPSSTLQNTSLETGTLSPWFITPNDTSCQWQVDNTSENARSGLYYLKLARNASQANCTGVRQSVTLTPVLGDTYRFAIWAKSSNPGIYRSLRLALNGLGAVPESTNMKFSGIGDMWTCLEVSHTINQGNLTGIQVQVQPEDLDGTEIFLDDAHLALNTGPICAQVIPPTNLTASDEAAVDSVIIKWDAVPGATHYRVYRSTDLTSEKIQVALVLDNSYIDKDGTYYDTYYYWVKACNANGCSIYTPPESGGFAPPFLDFFDGFENGSTSKWIDRVNPNKINACATSPINGVYHLCINANTQTSAFIVHNLPNTTNMAQISFKIDPNTATLGSREYVLLEARDSNLNKIGFRVKLTQINTTYNLKVEGQDNLGNTIASGWFQIPDSSSLVDVRWNSTIGHLRTISPLSGFSLYINGVEKVNLTGILNNLIGIDQLLFGAMVNQTDTNATGQFYMDDFSFSGPLFIRPKSP